VNDREQLTALAKKGERFRRCPIVDDDFPAIRDDFDAELEKAHRHLDRLRPTVVCLCGSTRFKDAWHAEGKRLTHEGKIVLSVGDLDTSEANRAVNVPLAPELKAKLDELHLRKIDLADEVLILNVGGYIGESTRRELNYARSLGKPVTFLEPQTACERAA
jgi:cell division protein FtsB